MKNESKTNKQTANQLEIVNYISFRNHDIDDFKFDFSRTELAQYNIYEQRKILLKMWIDKLNACNDYEEFKNTVGALKQKYSANCNSEIFFHDFLKFFLYNFIFNGRDDTFNIITQFLNDNDYFDIEKSLCLIYNPQDVLNAYNNQKFYTALTAKKWKDRLKWFVEDLENNDIKFIINSYFDEKTHFFVFHKIGKWKDNEISYDYDPILVEIFKYFETFEELAEFLNGDLNYCDLSKAIIPNIDFSKYKVSENTKLPIQYQRHPSYDLKKIFDRKEKIFVVKQNWSDEYGNSIKNYTHKFCYFGDFVHFLKNDLSGADLLFYDGLENIADLSDINFANAKLKSTILDKLGIKYKRAINDNVEHFPVILNNEIATANELAAERMPVSFAEALKCQKIYYISDLHLLHRLNDANLKSLDDAYYVVQKIVDNFLDEVILDEINNLRKNVILIGGDTSSDFSIFELFVKTLRQSISEKKLNINVVFTLGNHELWDFAELTLDEIINKYKKILTENKMYLLQNNLIFKYNWNEIGEVSTDELQNISKTELTNRLKNARLILFGGLGFAGYNEEFNANQLIYRLTLNRRQEIEESKKFEKLYEKVCTDLSDKRVVIFTHMPQKDWCSHSEPHKNFVYVNGHTHRNYFYDDGDYRIYADNQIGYRHKNFRLKYFYLDDDYDIFADYTSGIYEITREDYIDFYLGKNISLWFSRDFAKLYMLKKSGYYMFVLKSKKGNLNILNGGALKRLEQNDITYYFEKMDKIISFIKSPLDEFSKYQKQISDEIKAIGGSGSIHGAIIDIDFFNHLYINPIDLKITAYWASDIINKVVYADVPTLLQSNCPTLYANYRKQLEGNINFATALKSSNLISAKKVYLATDIYRASMEIKKMQKLNSNILSIWLEPDIKKLKDIK